MQAKAEYMKLKETYLLPITRLKIGKSGYMWDTLECQVKDDQ